MSKFVVIVTHSNDNASVDQVSESIRAAGLTPLRFNTDKYPTEFLLEAQLHKPSEEPNSNRPHAQKTSYSHSIITPEGERVPTSAVHSVWYRRFYGGQDIDKHMEQQMRSACLEESKRCILGFLSCHDHFQIDDYWKIRRASNKDYQLKLAAEIGFDIPDTLVTNNEKAAREFFNGHNGNIITKMQSSFAIWKDGEEHVVFTNEVEQQHLDSLEGLRQCPMVFQEKIDKALELRVTVVGNQVFCAAIDSNAHKEMAADWRKKGADTLTEWFKYDLPEELTQKVRTLTSRLGLNYGGIDILLTPDQQYKFLEINPCGEFYWMDLYTKLGICDAIAKTLINRKG